MNGCKLPLSKTDACAQHIDLKDKGWGGGQPSVLGKEPVEGFV